MTVYAPVIGYAVIDAKGINIKTIHDSERGAIVNWLAVVCNLVCTNQTSDASIYELWHKFKGGAVVTKVIVEVVA